MPRADGNFGPMKRDTPGIKGPMTAGLRSADLFHDVVGDVEVGVDVLDVVAVF